MKKILGLLLVLTLSIFVVSCEKEKTGVGYGLVHKNYVGKATVKMKGKKLVDFEFEEYFLLETASLIEKKASWTTKDEDGKDVFKVPDNVIETDKNHGDDKEYHAKYMLVDGKLYTGTTITNNNGKVKAVYKNSEGKNITDVVKVEADALKYVDAAISGKVIIVDAADKTEPSTILTVIGLVKENFAKSKSSYWKKEGDASKEGDRGWKQNIANLKEAFMKTGLEATYERGTKETNWKSGDYTSSVSLTDFPDYHEVTKRAAANIK